MRRAILILTLIFVGSASDVFSQVRELSEAEFYLPLRAAEEKRYKSFRRETKKLKGYSKGVLERTKEEIEEFLSGDRQRYISVKKSNNESQKLELLKIGTNYYQRKDDGEWTKEKTWSRGDGLRAIPIPVSTLYTVEKTIVNNQPVQLYRFFAVYDEYKPKEGEEKQTYWEQKTWIDNNGFEIREEIIVGKPISKEITSRSIYEYEYNPNIKIEAPIIKDGQKNSDKP